MDSSQQPEKLPPHPNLQHLQKQAKHLVKANSSLKLADAQHQIALAYGFKSWADLAREVKKRSADATAVAFPLNDPTYVQARLEWLVPKAAGPTATVAAAVTGDEVRFYQVGSGSEAQTEVGPDRLFDSGSLVHLFTGLLLVESERLGKVSRSDRVSKFFFPPDDPIHEPLAPVTLFALATHTAGLPLFPRDVNQQEAILASLGHGHPMPSLLTYERDSMVRALRSSADASPPNRQVAFSEFGIALLGEALAIAWGKSFHEVLREVILAPLGMTSSQVGPETFAPAMGLKTTARDLGQFLSSVLNSKPEHLSQAFQTALRPRFGHPNVVAHVGLGWWLADKSPQSVAWYHRSLSRGRAIVAIDRGTRTGIAVLSTAPIDPGPFAFEWLNAKLPPRRPFAPWFLKPAPHPKN